MRAAVIGFIIGLLQLAGNVAAGRLATRLATRADANKKRPISKVVVLLKDMKVQLEKEQQEDEEIFDKLSCWCEKNYKDKTKAIEEAEARISQLTAAIEAHTATSARLEQEIKNHNEEIAANIKALAQATEIRDKEHGEFSEEEKDMLQSIQALKAAITVLSKHHAPPPETLLNIRTMVRSMSTKYKWMLGDKVAGSRIRSFLQQPADHLSQSPTFKQPYAPQSGEIFGILRDMKDNFEANMSDAQKEELQKQKAYEELKAAKEAEINAGREQMEQKTVNLADTKEKLAQAKQDIEDTRNSLGADQRYLMDLKVKCQQTDEEWNQRQKTRQEELQAVTQAIAILSNDDAHDTFTSTFNPSLMQVRVHSLRRMRDLSGRSVRDAAASLIRRAAGNSTALHPKELLAIATSMGGDPFKKVKKAIDNMVEQLTKEKQDEITHRDWCISELNTNERQTDIKTRDRGDLEIKIDELEQSISTLGKEIETLEAEIKESQLQIQRAGRRKTPTSRQATIRDQQEAQKLIAQAIQVLKAFYEKEAVAPPSGTELIQATTAQQQHQQQQEPAAGPPPPPGFKSYEN
ncbi:unnamed protein product [Vitrella brassicaformis CCMP3155]|uniref:Uncharacterized protein n=1 Tax=Vitrella brassicaformis (strain CCMP3155) TaxID=1169540 RepID=A0A0G4GXC2_VITBC|nr:unnamed protein product [Vitrella brassicaformis CCMP3155]|eukprot:CEM35713.1 unnamed protein product [Vitrella brassicaformis CCMP3155]